MIEGKGTMMRSFETTNFLLGVIAVALAGHLALALLSPPAQADTYRLDSCITTKPYEKPAAYLHVVMHGMADVETTQDLKKR